MLKMNKFLAVICMIVSASCYAGAINITSPDGHVAVEVGVDSAGTPFYNVRFVGERVIDDSHLGFNLVDNVDLKDDFEIIGDSCGSFDEIWRPVWREEAEIRSNYNEALLRLRQRSTGRLVDLQSPDFDDLIVRHAASDEPLIPGKMSLDAGHHLAGAERLGNIVVGSQSQASDLVNIFFLGRYHDNGGVLYLPHLPADLKSVRSGINRSYSSANALESPVSPSFSISTSKPLSSR